MSVSILNRNQFISTNYATNWLKIILEIRYENNDLSKNYITSFEAIQKILYIIPNRNQYFIKIWIKQSIDTFLILYIQILIHSLKVYLNDLSRSKHQPRTKSNQKTNTYINPSDNPTQIPKEGQTNQSPPGK